VHGQIPARVDEARARLAEELPGAVDGVPLRDPAEVQVVALSEHDEAPFPVDPHFASARGRRPPEVVLALGVAERAVIAGGQEGVIGEIEDIEPGKRGKLTVTLSAVKYVRICNIVGHYQLGMRRALTVR
jgi:hypothetical protein